MFTWLSIFSEMPSDVVSASADVSSVSSKMTCDGSIAPISEARSRPKEWDGIAVLQRSALWRHHDMSQGTKQKTEVCATARKADFGSSGTPQLVQKLPGASQ